MSFVSGAFLVALFAAAGPFIIHLLNRRRFRTVEWAAMDFLRTAVRRNKRVLELRDLLLMILRTLAVALFVLAMAQPFMSSGSKSAYTGQPVHAVIVVDNSLSMAYKPLDKTLLDLAKTRAASFVKELPEGSRISIFPLAGSSSAHHSAYASPEDALEALGHISLVDRSTRISDAAELARRAAAEVPDLPTKRIVIISDMQRNSWSEDEISRSFQSMNDVQLVAVGPSSRSNVWISELSVRDGMADSETPALFTATLRYEGEAPRTGVRAVLKAGDVVVGDQTVSLTPGQHLQLIYQHRFTVAGSAGEPLYVPVTLEISGDELNEDNSRSILVPVIARLPVVFVDQYGSREQPRMSRYGETYPLRRMLAARRPGESRDNSLIEVRHLAIEQVTRELLADARMVVMAGVRAPTDESVTVLREYVTQGGPVFIAAGGEFESQAWMDIAWNDGRGILPAPLREMSIGKLPTPTSRELKSFGLDATSLTDPAFDLELTENERNAILNLPFFYKAISVDTESIDTFSEALRMELETQSTAELAYAESEKAWSAKAQAGGLSAADAQAREEAHAKFSEGRANWLKWVPTRSHKLDGLSVDQRLALSRPVIMGRYDNGEVFAVRRSVGKGSIVMMTSGLFPEWNNLAADAGVVLLDGLVRGLLSTSLPDRNIEPANEWAYPVLADDQQAAFQVFVPGEEIPISLSPDPLSPTTFGLRLGGLHARGVYRIERLPDAGEEATGGWTRLLALNGPASESELNSLDAEEFKASYTGDAVKWVDQEGKITLAGGFAGGHRLWKWLLGITMACLVLEMLVLKEKRQIKESNA
ncbi:MAG: hypothetical protein ACI9TH_001989 [Kiritimatiellia bacterium]